ncbi:MAG: cytochrome c biogenesis protein ResB, partial [Verrucomicrobiota bacterium]|nr:cytochrome c biogenesis protein ResB [Verrucomicrobiota bacterium]
AGRLRSNCEAGFDLPARPARVWFTARAKKRDANDPAAFMAKTSRQRPELPWQKNPVFRFFASLQLAMLLLGVLIVAAIIGTLYESNFDAKIARAYIYAAPWFNVWLVLLALNLTVSALSRMPWQKRHTGFLITHLGIIVLLAGSLLGRLTGIEGTMTLFKNEPPNNHLVTDARALHIAQANGAPQTFSVEVLNRKPSPEHPRFIADLAAGYRLDVVGYSDALAVKMEPEPASDGGVSAVHITIATAMMGQQLDSWLLADDPAHGTFDLGLARLIFKRGAATASTSTPKTENADAVDIEEKIFAFSKVADQVSRAVQGGSTGAKVRLANVQPGGAGEVTVTWNDKTATLDLSKPDQDVPLAGTPFSARIEKYFPDFRMQKGEPVSLSDEPNNPCVLVTLRGHAIPVAAAPAVGDAPAEQNQLTLFVSDGGELSYELQSRKLGRSSGTLKTGESLPTGWADWKLVADRFLPRAIEHFSAAPATPASGNVPRTEGLLVRASKQNETVERWAPLGWQVTMPLESGPARMAYGFKQIPLPIGLRLQEFEVEHDEGTETPAGFKSTVEITNMAGETAIGQCWMNNPISFPDAWPNRFSGLTYKISQASWNPENLAQSTVQILRDPGWSLKWIGSLLVVAGIFTMFYIREPRDLNETRSSRSSKNAKNARFKTSRRGDAMKV